MGGRRRRGTSGDEARERLEAVTRTVTEAVTRGRDEGRGTCRELKAAMRDIGMGLNDSEIDTMMTMADLDRRPPTPAAPLSPTLAPLAPSPHITFPLPRRPHSAKLLLYPSPIAISRRLKSCHAGPRRHTFLPAMTSPPVPPYVTPHPPGGAATAPSTSTSSRPSSAPSRSTPRLPEQIRVA